MQLEWRCCVDGYVVFVLNFSLKEDTGGAERDRTADLIRARDALSQTELLPHKNSINYYHPKLSLGCHKLELISGFYKIYDL